MCIDLSLVVEIVELHSKYYKSRVQNQNLRFSRDPPRLGSSSAVVTHLQILPGSKRLIVDRTFLTPKVGSSKRFCAESLQFLRDPAKKSNAQQIPPVSAILMTLVYVRELTFNS
ncbi:unnamed protein product [Sphagnum troendelagicum]|uniref:Uncharacterized protein n=1 Tax=Sphagnum troendelagicum TaxID=128251 RepID=A0ABP0UM65_9BRYO